MTATPTIEQIDVFLVGMEHALTLAEGRKRGRLSSQSHAIRTELTTLRLLAERYKAKQSIAPVQVGFNKEPGGITWMEKPVSHATVIGEAVAAFALFALPVLFLFGYYAVTGQMVDFGGGQ